MDERILSAWVEELSAELAGKATLQRACSLNLHTVSLQWNSSLGNLDFCLKPWCLFAAWRPASRVPADAQGGLRVFCQLLERELQGARLEAVGQAAQDRILRMTFRRRDQCRHLVWELIPAFPNCLLLDENETVTGLFKMFQAGRRSLAPGQLYELPGRRPDPSEAQDIALREPDSPAGNPDGILADAATELLPVQPTLLSPEPLNRLDWRRRDPWRDLRLALHSTGEGAGGTATAFPTVNGLLCFFARIAEEYLLYQERRKEALNRIGREIRKQQRALAAAAEDERAVSDPAGLRRQGELLLAHIGELKKRWVFPAGSGEEAVVPVPDLYAEGHPPVFIAVQPSKNVSANAEAYFQKARKAERGRERIRSRMDGLGKSLDVLRAEEKLWQEACRLAELPGTGKKAVASASAPKEKSPGKAVEKREKKIPGCRRFVSRDGYVILVGQSAQGNDYLTFRVAGEFDLWLHTADYAGSHVVVRNPSRKPVPPETLLEAARLAAFYSSARSQPRAEVHYTEKRFVSKVKGGPPGLVRLQKQKSVSVSPSPRGAGN